MAKPTDDPMAKKWRLKREVGHLFTPATPINEKDLFSGRRKQVEVVLSTVSQMGQHAILFGERGVGKTSLANVIAGFFRGPGNQTVVAPIVTCHTADSFPALWNRVFMEIKADRPSLVFGPQKDNATLADLYKETYITPDVVREALAPVADKSIMILIIDEFDRLADAGDKQLFADTIKVISDKAVKATIILVGVADTVDELIAGHESIQRNLVQVPMPRMSYKEVEQIIKSRLPKVNMTVAADALGKICALSRGLPHYAHLIGQHAAWAAIEAGDSNITISHVNDAMTQLINNSQQTVTSAYHKATTSPNKKNLFSQVLLASAMAHCDDLGYFAAADVREPLSRIMGEEYDIPRYIKHLATFCDLSRGEILQQIGERYQRRFRFKNPLMQPYIVMRGVASGMIDLDTLQDSPEVPGEPG